MQSCLHTFCNLSLFCKVGKYSRKLHPAIIFFLKKGPWRDDGTRKGVGILKWLVWFLFSELRHYDSFHAAFAALIRCLLKDLFVYLYIYLKVAGNLNLNFELFHKKSPPQDFIKKDWGFTKKCCFEDKKMMQKWLLVGFSTDLWQTFFTLSQRRRTLSKRTLREKRVISLLRLWLSVKNVCHKSVENPTKSHFCIFFLSSKQHFFLMWIMFSFVNCAIAFPFVHFLSFL